MKIITTIAATALLATVGAAAASAAPLSGTFNISIYQGAGNGNASDPANQAVLGNPLITGTPFGTTTYTGAINFNTSGAAVTIADFLSSASGTFTPFANSGATISTAPFQTTTIFVITGTTAGAITGAVTHDDGASLYQGGSTVFEAGAPTTAEISNYTLSPGDFTLVYAEANGLPAVLTFDANPVVGTPVPEPATLALLGLGMAGIGLVRRRRAG